jgi:hypothetical protein
MFLRIFVSISFLPLALSSCSSYRSEPNPVRDMAIETGVAGTVVGAGTGAVVGAVIANGDIAMSALAGAAIGLPVGLVAGAMYARHLQQEELDLYQNRIDENTRIIRNRQIEINELRKDIDHDSRSIDLDPSNRRNIYQGPSLGTYYRKPGA